MLYSEHSVGTPVGTGRNNGAWDVEQALWWVYGPMSGLLLGDGVEGVSVEYGYGCQVAAVGNVAHPDAVIVHRAVSDLPDATLVIRHAQATSRPDAMVGAVPRWQRRFEVDSFGRKRAVNYYEDDSHKRVIGWGVTLIPDPRAVEMARFVYGRWHAQLVLLADALTAATVKGRRLAGPSAPATPWLDSEPVARVQA